MEGMMDYQIAVSENNNYIIIKYLVPMTTNIALISGPELLQIAKENEINRFLFDMRESNNEQSVTDNYIFANEKIQTFEYPRNSIAAFLINPDDHSHDFITTVFQNAGYILSQFTSEDEAVNWLNKNLDAEE